MHADLNLMVLSGLDMTMRGTDLNTQRLEARLFSRGGFSVLETDWPVKFICGADTGKAALPLLIFFVLRPEGLNRHVQC